MPAKSTPSAVSRVRVKVELDASTSTSPLCRAGKRLAASSGTNSTFWASPKIAAAPARQRSTPSPLYFPLSSTLEKPWAVAATPQTSCPRALTASSVGPASARWVGRIAARPIAAAKTVLRMVLPDFSPTESLGAGDEAGNRQKIKAAALSGGGLPWSCQSLADCRSADWWGVLQAALRPQLVHAAIDLEDAVLADVAVEALAVVTDLLDDVVDPLLVEAERLAHARRDAEDALDRRVVALQHLVDVLGVDAVLLGLEHGEQRPRHDVAELVVAVAHHRTERLLGDDLR